MKIKIDLTKAKEIKKEQIRAERAPLLQKLDVEFMRAVEQNNTVKQQEIASQKQALRDATEDPVITKAKTVEKLKLARPQALNIGV